MAPHAVSLTKKFTWRGTEELFSNIYHYDDNGTGAPYTQAGWNSLIDAVKAAEAPAFGSNVTYVQGRAWGPTNAGQAASVTLAIKDLTGTGTQAGTAEIGMEMALVVQKYIGRSPVHNRKRFLRKFLHIARAGSTDIGSATNGNGNITTNMRTIGTDYAGRIQSVTVGGIVWVLCAPNGTKHDAASAAWTVLDQLHVRQLKQ